MLNGKANSKNSYLLTMYFDAGKDGFAGHREAMHVNVIAKSKIEVDGDLNDWSGVIPTIPSEMVPAEGPPPDKGLITGISGSLQ